MPYILSPILHDGLPGLWGEGPPCQSTSIYDINSTDPKLPPVNYDAHTLKPHSIPHVDAAKHIIPNGMSIDQYFSGGKTGCFYGPVTVLKIKSARWQTVQGSKDIHIWRISPEEILRELEEVSGSQTIPDKIFISPDQVPLTKDGFHDPSYVFVLSNSAAEMIVANRNFNAFGTSWKSSDFEPGSRERPIHKILLEQAILFEYLKLDHVPAGRYFLSAFPICIAAASESPCTPILYRFDELNPAIR